MSEQRMTNPVAAAKGAGGAKRAQDFAAVRDWPGYFDLMVGKPARETLVAALASFAREDAAGGDPTPERLAVDLGCGEGRDTLELLSRGWRVVALDGHPKSVELLEPRVRPEDRGRLKTCVASFADATWPESVDLFNASFSLPFCEPEDWESLWQRIVASIRPGGRFAGQLFGDRDGWAVLPDRTHHRRGELDGLFEGFVFEELREEERPDTNHDGKPKPWHVFHIVARKRGNA
ncbi:MAG: class I SAM-dependent methyltransferase [Phycisphaeraceae bacterium]|nr:MAG: class I SAM-dependent methyltransferase [Phycisphaeraceae bacterium]